MLYQSEYMEEQAILQTAARMCAAARTAPKAYGKDTLHTIVLTGEEKEKLAQKMDFVPDCLWLGIPISISGKNIFFDREIFHD